MNDYRTELDYTNNPYQDESEQLYQYALRSQSPGGYEGYADNGLTIPGDVYANALSRVIDMRQGGPEVYNTSLKADKPEYTEQVWWREPNENLALRNADHGLQSQRDWYSYGPLTAPRAVLYNVIKWLAQNLDRSSGIPEGLDAIGRSRIGQRILGSTDERPFSEASPPSWESLKWGLRPFWGKN